MQDGNGIIATIAAIAIAVATTNATISTIAAIAVAVTTTTNTVATATGIASQLLRLLCYRHCFPAVARLKNTNYCAISPPRLATTSTGKRAESGSGQCEEVVGAGSWRLKWEWEWKWETEVEVAMLQ